MRISVHERKEPSWQPKQGKCNFSDKNQLKIAEFQLVQVGKVGKQNVQKLNKWTIPCLVFRQFSRGTVAGL